MKSINLKGIIFKDTILCFWDDNPSFVNPDPKSGIADVA
ncbi:MAG: hypothetical protein RLZZ77_47 [Bacteroidota bacterium]